MKTIVEILTESGFSITPMNGEVPYGYDIAQYTPAGEDWHITVWKLTDLVEFAETFDPEDEMGMWCEAKHCGSKNMRDSIPGYAELWKDQLWKQKILAKVANQIRRNKNV